MKPIHPYQKHSDAIVLVHVVWSTYRREQKLGLTADRWLATLLSRKAAELRCILLAVGNTADHVHVLVRLAATVSLAALVQRLKGASSYAYNFTERFRWQEGYWAESVAPRDLRALRRYVLEQRQHHDGTEASEPWQHQTSTWLLQPRRQPGGAGLARGCPAPAMTLLPNERAAPLMPRTSSPG